MTSVRTYQRRRRRLGVQAAAALERLPHLQVAAHGPAFDPAVVFGRVAPLVLEVGCGTGEATAAMAAADPDRDVLAVDVHEPGVARLLRHLEASGLANVRVCHGDAVAVLTERIGPGALAELRAYFPDPWPKARHHKRRLLQPPFLALVADRLAPGGVLHVATDWPAYAEAVAAALDDIRDFEVVHRGARPAHRPTTRFEQRGLTAGRPVCDLLAVRR